MAQDTSAPDITDSGPAPRPGGQETPPPVPQPGTSVRRVPLARLLSVVVLNPAQAALVAARLLEAVHLGGTTNGGPPTAPSRWAVVLTPGGDVEVARAPAGEGAEVGELLEQLTDNARRLPAHPRPEQLALLRRLEEAAADTHLAAGDRARTLEGALAEVLGPDASRRLSGQLAALVGAFAHIAPSVAVPAAALAAPGGAPPGPHRATPTPSRPGRPPWRRPPLGRRRARTRRTALALALVAVGLAGSGYLVLRDSGDGGGDAVGRDPAPSTPTKTGPADAEKKPAQRPRSRPDVQALADRSAGPVTGVEVRRNAACTPGAACPVTVTVRLSPADTARSVSWRVGAARLCERGITWTAPTTVTAQPGWTSVYASTSVPVPDGRSLALVALTGAPAEAQSPPVPVTGSSLRC